MKIGFVGAGKVGFTLGKYFAEHGICVTGYYSRTSESAQEAADFTKTRCFASIEQVLTESDILFLTVPDSEIKAVWDLIKTMPVRGKIICHCSGLLSSAIFDGIAEKQAYGYSIHPFFAISSKYNSYEKMSQAFFTIEGGKREESEKYLQDIKCLLERLGNPVYVVKEQDKAVYHTAAVFLSNHVAALAHLGCKLLKRCGFGEDMISAALNTLFLSHCAAIAENGAIKSLTGSVERNDLTTVKKHMECLGGSEKDIYRLLSAQLIEMSKEKHSDRDYSDMESLINIELI